MVYFVGTRGLDLYRQIWTGIDIEYQWLYYPAVKCGNPWVRRCVHFCWRMGFLPKWKCYSESFYRDISDIESNDHVIIFVYFPEPVLSILPFFNRSVHIHLWLWDNFSKLSELKKYFSMIKRQNVTIHTFDPLDAKTYSIGFLPQMYSMRKVSSEVDVVRDCFYIGQANNPYRIRYEDKIKLVLEKESLSYKFHIVDGKHVKYLSYEENLRLLKESKCVIEICEETQSGLTLRSLEALLYRKKLITNNSYIKNYDFYRSENIFVWGIDRIEDLSLFLHSDYREVPQNIINGYDVNLWLSKILSS